VDRPRGRYLVDEGENRRRDDFPRRHDRRFQRSFPRHGQGENALMHPALSLCHRELVRFLRQRHRIVGALATPIVFWLLVGAGMNRSFKSDTPGGENYLHYFFPGTVLMILLFTAIFSTISVIEDRREGFLQGVLVAPVS